MGKGGNGILWIIFGSRNASDFQVVVCAWGWGLVFLGGSDHQFYRKGVWRGRGRSFRRRVWWLGAAGVNGHRGEWRPLVWGRDDASDFDAVCAGRTYDLF